MKKIILFFILILSIASNGQQKIFENPIPRNNLLAQSQLSSDLQSTFVKTDYYLQNAFNLLQNLTLKLPDNSIIEAVYQRTFNYNSNSFSVVYKILNQDQSQLVLSEYNGTITGMYQSETNKKFVFQQTNTNVFAVSEVNETGFSDKEKALDYIESYRLNNENDILINNNVCLESTPICAGNTVIDLMVVYTASAKDLWGSNSIANSNIITSITNLNVALLNSGITNISFRLVYLDEIDYFESGVFATDLNRLRSQTDGFIDDIHAIRTSSGADLVALIIGSPNTQCGIGNLNSVATNYSNTVAFTVTLYSCVVSNFSLAHELGHNMGLNHDWYVNTSQNPCAHHHGYVNQTAVLNGTSSTNSQRWRTIMAYNNQCSEIGFTCTRINRWSNPNVNFNQEPTGIAIDEPNPSDEAFGFRRFACVVADFMPTVLNTNSFSKTNIAVFPNPMNNFVQVFCEEPISKIMIVNFLGQTVLTTQQKNINTETFASGIYFLTVFDADNAVLGIKKMIKK